MCVRGLLFFTIIVAMLAFCESRNSRRRAENEVLKPRTVDVKCRAARKSCQPRDTYVEIESNEISKLLQHVVLVKRCSGICNGFKRCLPTATRNTTLSIKARGKCEKVIVEEHTRCKCDCKTKKNDCLPHMIFRPDRCSCECPPKYIQDCRKGKARQMNMEKCTCECKRRDCTTGTIWDTRECRCVFP